MPDKKKNPEGIDHSQLDLWSTKKDFQWEDFKVAREYIHSIGLQDYAGWEKLFMDASLKDIRIPENPDKVYKHLGWNGWQDWLGIEQVEKRDSVTL